MATSSEDLTREKIRELRDYSDEDDETSEVSIMKVGTLKMQFDPSHRGYIAKALAVLILAASVALLIAAWRYTP